MQAPQTDVDVLIVGAGPVGLFLANECARRSLRWRIVEQHPTQSEHSKALAVFPRTLEIFDMCGIVEPFLSAANRVTALRVVAHRRPLARVPFMPEESPYPFVAMVPQDRTERLFVEALEHKGGSVEYLTTFVSAVEGEHAVDVTLERDGTRSALTAQFVVGCDGAHSAVRHGLNVSFEGAQYDATYMLGDVQTNEALPSNELQLCPHEAGPLGMFPMGSNRWRIIATVAEASDGAPSLDVVRSTLQERGPEGVEVLSLHWSSFFNIHHRQVAQMRFGRIFLAGDSAHIHSPFGGQGMNTGLQDVWNLAWKLALAVRGRAKPELLDSYSAERQPVIERVIELTDFMTKVLATPGKLAQGIRDLAIPVVSKLAPFQHNFVERLSELGIAYRGSLIVQGHGERYFDDSLRAGGIGGRFLLFAPDGEASHAAGAERLAAQFRDLVETRPSRNGGLSVVRPDGYIAYESANGVAPGVYEAASAVLDRQITHA